MGNILNDIVEEVNIKPNKTKLLLKWGISIAGSLITIAFVFGQFKASFFNRMDKFEKSIIENTVAIEQMKTEMNTGFQEVNARIDKSYIDGLATLQDYQEFNKKQLILVLDYGQTNKALLKEMLELNMQEKSKNIENQVMQAKDEPVALTEKPELSIKVKPAEHKDYIGLVYMIEVENNDTIFSLTGATMEYINKLNKKTYKLGEITPNKNVSGRFDVEYKRK
jgi:uncharacterized protein YehS (DUF1456 family)